MKTCIQSGLTITVGEGQPVKQVEKDGDEAEFGRGGNAPLELSLFSCLATGEKGIGEPRRDSRASHQAGDF